MNTGFSKYRWMIYNTLNQSTTTEISSEGLFYFLKKWKRGASLPTLLKKTFPPPKKKSSWSYFSLS